MTDLSPFQTLPIHNAEAIARYCIGLQRHRHKDRYVDGNKARRVWLILHDVSSSWMELARRNLNNCVTLRLSSNPENDGFTTTLHSRRVLEQSAAILPLVKVVNIYFDSIVEDPKEEDLEKLDRLWPEDLVFPKARSLTCVLASKDTITSKNARSDRYFKWFIERVRSSFPNLQEITVEFGRGRLTSIGPSVLFSADWNASLFLSALFRTAMWEMDDISSSAYMDNEHILIQNAPELITSFCYPESNNHEFASWIIKKSAQTLEKLYYSEMGGGSLKDFMFDDDGQVIVYPRLRDLRVLDSSYNKGERTTHESIAPFPVLQRLRVYSSCMFIDDTLFRGSRDTLVSLDIGIHRGFVDIFRKYNMYSQGAYPNILHITATREHIHGLTITADEFIEAAFGLVSSATQSMTINGFIPYQHIRSAIPTCPYLDNIHILILNTKLSMLEVLDVFKYFPYVTDFGCSFRRIDSELAAIQDKLIPSHLGTQCSQFVSRLKCWHMYYSGGASVEEMAVLFVTLAVLCPSFTYVKEWKNNREAYDSKIGYILSSGLYDEHAERLGHLFE